MTDLPTDRRLNSIFGIDQYKEVIIQEDRLPVPVASADEEDPDIIESIEAIKAMAKTGEDMLATLSQVAQNSEKARDYEVAATLMKATIEAHKTVIEEKRKQAVEKEMSAPVTNNTVIFNTTEDILRLLPSLKQVN